MKDQRSSTSTRRHPDEAQIRTNPQSGSEYIYVESPEVVSSADMTDADAQAFENARPTEEEIKSNRWSQ